MHTLHYIFSSLLSFKTAVFLLFFYSFFSCTIDDTAKEEKKDAEKQKIPLVLEENADVSTPTASIVPEQIREFQDKRRENPVEDVVNAREVQSDLINARELLGDSVSFPKEYGATEQWKTVRLGQKQANVSLLRDSKEDFLDLLQRNAELGYNRPSFLPSDIIVGSLENRNQTDSRVQDIIKLLDAFFADIKSGEIEDTLAKYVSSDEVVVVSRQISYSQNYGKYISSYRLGKLVLIDSDRESAQVRVLARYPTFDARVKVRIYFQRIDGEWYIAVIEGDFNELVEPYKVETVFEPSGILGISQGF